MSTGYVLYNKMAGQADSFQKVKSLTDLIHDELKFIDVLDVSDYRLFIGGLEKGDYIILAGGDGTLNRFINNTDGIKFDNEVLYFPNGTGNDFAHDLGFSGESSPFSIKEHLKDLPSVSVNGKNYRFINGVGFGIDGYCCEVGDELRKTPGKKVNYTSIAIKGLLFHYKPTNAEITIDRKKYTYKKVWLAPAMNGRFYGGGMMATPNQKRNSDKITTMVFHGSGRLKTLMIFPSIFKGEHVKHTKYVEILEGNKISVKFDRPVALQIDGETILGVSSYTACAAGVVAKKETCEEVLAK